MDEVTQPIVGWREVAAAAPGGVGVLLDDEFADVSPEFASLFDREESALAGRSWRSVIEPDEHARIEDALARARTDGEWNGTVATDGAGIAVDLRLSSTDGGAILWVATEPDERGPVAAANGEGGVARDPGGDDSGAVDPDGDTGAAVGTGGDAESAEGVDGSGSPAQVGDPPDYEAVVDAVDDGIYALDEDLRFTFVNDAVCELTGLPREELLGTPAVALIEDDDEVADAAAVRQRVVETAREQGSISATVRTPDGKRHLETRFRLHPPTDDEFRGSVGVIRDVTAVRELQADLREHRRFVENVVDSLDDVLYVIDEAGEFAFWNDELCERFGYDDDEVADVDPHSFLTPADADVLPPDPADIVDVEDQHAVVDLVTSDGETIPHEIRGVTYADEGSGERYRVGIARDVTDRLERERTLRRQHEELATLDRINELLMETTREVIQTASREAVEQAVCDRLASSELYRFAWVGEPAYGEDDRLVPRATGGPADGYLEDVTITADDSETGQGPVGRAMATGEVQVVDVADPAFEPWREAASERGVESVAAVPLQDETTVYGVLVVYATREKAFTDRERDGFEMLGRTVGSVIRAAKNRDLLFADAVVELSFRAPGDDDRYVATAADLECELELEGYVSTGDRWVLYLSVDGAPAGDVIDALGSDPGVERARVIGEAAEGDHGGTVELVVSDTSLLATVAAAGAIVRDLTVDPDGVDLVVEAPADAEIREVADRVRRAFPGADLLARRDRDREARSAGAPGGLLAGLTDRQREVLEVAYRAGYFSWPRDSTGEDVAAALDLAPPTLHAHLRKAEAEILSSLFESG